jgi:hypothetical protein
MIEQNDRMQHVPLHSMSIPVPVRDAADLTAATAQRTAALRAIRDATFNGLMNEEASIADLRLLLVQLNQYAQAGLKP